jgi:hypothetical protein
MYDTFLDLSNLIETIPVNLKRAVDLNLEDDIDEDGSFFVATIRTMIDNLVDKSQVN